ncbi:hypothetical protein COT30_03690 [Candidatus Micrarchaeota archaeon CG08_land_8_20_14_0_20_49_17]|nr:MAG: hypothetical protein COT30_03690 [Candidatus Micrarchaeota archaeon CG08_land_8_20_14_0_20_49_17]
MKLALGIHPRPKGGVFCQLHDQLSGSSHQLRLIIVYYGTNTLFTSNGFLCWLRKNYGNG